MYNALVTGATGFMGRHLLGKLIDKGVNISILVRDDKNIDIDRLQKVKIYKGDITDKNALALIGKDIDVVFHLVAVNIHQAPRTEEEKKHVYKVNVEGTRNILEAFASSLKHFIFSSSISVYDGIKSSDRLDENHKAKPNNIYGETKLIAEELIADYGKKYGFLTTSLRFPFVYGPGNKGNIFRMIEAIDKRRFILIGRGDNTRNAIYVDNAIEAALSVVGRKIANGKSYIVTDGLDYTVRQIYMAIVKSLGMRPISFYIPYWFAKIFAKAGDAFTGIFAKPFPFSSELLAKITANRRFSSQRFCDEIGFIPKYNFYNTIEKTVNWYRESKCRNVFVRK
jgi:nucleoside-diphosphate-sugar epimerase